MVESFKSGESSAENLREKDLVQEQTKLELQNLKLDVAGSSNQNGDEGGSVESGENPEIYYEKLCDKSSLTVNEVEWMVNYANENNKFLYLDGLEKIDKEIAHVLGKYRGNLYLNGLTSIDKEVATELAKVKGDLMLNGLTSIEPIVATELSKFGGFLYLNGLKSIDKGVAKGLSNFKGYLYLNGLTDMDKEVSEELSKFKGKALYLDGLTSITPEVAEDLSTFTGILSLDGLTSINKGVAVKLSKFGGVISLRGLKTIDREVAIQLVPLKTGLKVKDNVRKIIDDVKKELEKKEKVNQVTGATQRIVEETEGKIHWKGQRGNIEYDWERNVIKSWGRTVKVDKISERNIKLSGLDLTLGLEEGIWLANFKNWLKKTYGTKKVEFKRDLINRNFNFKKTFVVDGVMLITRGDLENRISICSDDKVMEKITVWLNK